MVREPHEEASDTFMWAAAGCGEPSPGGNYENLPPPLFNDEESVFVCVRGSKCIEAANNKILKTHKENQEQFASLLQTRLADVLLSLKPFGLCLTITPSFLDLMEQKLYCPKNEVTASNYSIQSQTHFNDFGSLHMSEKLKASNFSASLLKIGSWERVSRNEGDVVAKCYYAKRKLVWEILEGRLKRKIEIQWSDILSMEVKIRENEPGILHIELSQRPAFYEEIDPQPRKHTMWKLTTDFTGGEAYKCRRHYLVFPPGNLDKPYDKLLQCDERLLKLSRKPFPSLPWSPNFPDSTNGFTGCSFGYNASMLDIQRLGMHLGCSRLPSHLGTIQQPSLKETPSPISVMDFAHSDEHVGSQVFENPRVNIREQGMNNYGDAVARSQVQGIMQVDAAAPCQNHEVSLSSVSCQQLLSEFENHLFSDSESGFCDENDRLARVGSWAALVNPIKEENLASQNGSMHAVYEQANGIGIQYHQQPVSAVTPQISPENPMVHPPCNLSSLSIGQFCQQHDSWTPVQVSPENSSLHQPCDNFCYYHSSVVPDLSMESYGFFNTNNGVNPWS